MVHFLINSSVCLFSLWLVYKLLLENVSWHYFKRFYLLGSLAISAAIPFLVVRTVTVPLPQATPLSFPELEMVEATASTTGFEWDWITVLLIIYMIGVLIMAVRFIKNLYGLRIKPTDEVKAYEAYTLVLRKWIEVPHSFLTRIYASVSDYKSGAIPNAVLQHEKAHLDQKHSWDVLTIEMLLIVMWFNPLLYLIKYSIKLNHEFLADRAVLANGVATKTYQETLLAYSVNSKHRAIANTFNFPLIKKRFTIMKTHTTTASGLLRSLAIVPVLALLVISCGQEEIVVEPEVLEVVEEPKSTSPGNLIVVDRSIENGTFEVKEGVFKYAISNDKIEVFTLKGESKDLESLGYTILFSDQIEEVEIVDEDFPAPPPPPTALEYINENGKDLVYYIDDKKVSQSEAIKNIEIMGQNGVDISPDKNGNMAIKIKMTDKRWSKMPPPPPPVAPSSLSQEQLIANGSLKIYVNDKIATQAQLDKLASFKSPSDWKNITIYPFQKDGVRSTYFYGEGL